MKWPQLRERIWDVLDMTVAAVGIGLIIYEAKFTPPPIDLGVLAAGAGLFGAPGVRRSQGR